LSQQAARSLTLRSLCLAYISDHSAVLPGLFALIILGMFPGGIPPERLSFQLSTGNFENMG